MLQIYIKCLDTTWKAAYKMLPPGKSYEMYETTSQNVFQYILLIQTRMGRWHQCQGWVFWVHRRRVPGKAN